MRPHVKKVLWWLMAFMVFGLLGALLVDFWLFVNDTDATISATLQDYLGGSNESYRAAIFGFLVGSLLNHFAAWGRDT